jgi:hypothetical protein
LSRENRVETLDIEPRLIRLVGRRCAAWIEARAEIDKIEPVPTQNYIPPQTFFRWTWLGQFCGPFF